MTTLLIILGLVIGAVLLGVIFLIIGRHQDDMEVYHRFFK